MTALKKFSFGVGDRFGEEGRAQLMALLKLREDGVEVTPVWNKSHREHETVKSQPSTVRKEADEAVKALSYTGSYFVDADHIDLQVVESYLPVSDFFTIDVADFIDKEPKKEEKDRFLQYMETFLQPFQIPGIPGEFIVSEEKREKMIRTFLFAAGKASEVYQFIADTKQGEEYVIEVSMDEVEDPQSPIELFYALACLSFYNVPVNTIAPKFTGRFNKGVDYEGDLQVFAKEFEEDLLVLEFAKKEFNLPQNLKLSIHSGSDKFSIYPVMKRLIFKHNTGLHVKTAGTTWLEEITVIAESGEDGFAFAVAVYEEALGRFEELTSPYPDVLDIDKSRLPAPENIKDEGGEKLAGALRHDEEDKLYNPHLRQLMHCAYKIAAEKEQEFYGLLKKYRTPIETAVTGNLYDKHLIPLFKK